MIKFVSNFVGRWFSPLFVTNKTDRHDITEIVLKVALNTINFNLNPKGTIRSCKSKDCESNIHIEMLTAARKCFFILPHCDTNGFSFSLHFVKFVNSFITTSIFKNKATDLC